MGIGTSVFLLAVGAVLAFAVHTTVSGLDINVIGYILMLAGAVGLFLSMAIFGRRDRVLADDRVVVEDRAPVTEERVVRRRSV